MTVIEHEKLVMAGALLDKARASNYPREQEALAVRAYTLLAGFLNSIEPVDESGRRRERRLLKDRRRPGEWTSSPAGTRSSGPSVPSRYGDTAHSVPPVGIRLDIAL